MKQCLFLLSVFLFFFSSLSKIVITKFDGDYKLKHWYHNAEKPLDITKSPLNKKFRFPSSSLFSQRNNTQTYMRHIGELISDYGLWDTSKSVVDGTRVKDRPSYGCSVRGFAPWFEGAPSSSESLCGISTALVYSEQHSGTTLFTTSLDVIDSAAYMHGLFCCSTCANETVGITTYSQLACAYRLQDVGIKNMVILLQYHQFWNHLSEAIDYPTEMQLPVIILRRTNILAHYFAGGGIKGGKDVFKVEKGELRKLPKREKKFRKKFDRLYCGLKEAGVKVMMISYEELANERKETMNRVTKFLGMDPWQGKGLNHHIPLTKRIENLPEVIDYLKKEMPQYLCMVYENCEYLPDPSCNPKKNPYLKIK